MIVVAGEALVDVITRLDGVVDVVPGGGPFNAARAMGRLGVQPSFAGALSTDEHGEAMARSLAADGVSLDLVQRTDLPTTRAFAELDGHGEARYQFDAVGTSAPSLDGDRLLAALPAELAALYVGTLGLVFEPIATTIETLVGRLPDDAILVVDPNCRPPAIADPQAYRARMARILARADIVKLSTADQAYLGVDVSAPVVVLTDAGGPVRVRVAGEAHEVEVPAVEVVDTVGAGDTFGGALLAWLVQAGTTRGARPDPDRVLAAVRFAIRAAAEACRRPGADPPTLVELGGWGA